MSFIQEFTQQIQGCGQINHAKERLDLASTSDGEIAQAFQTTVSYKRRLYLVACGFG